MEVVERLIESSFYHGVYQEANRFEAICIFFSFSSFTTVRKRGLVGADLIQRLKMYSVRIKGGTLFMPVEDALKLMDPAVTRSIPSLVLSPGGECWAGNAMELKPVGSKDEHMQLVLDLCR